MSERAFVTPMEYKSVDSKIYTTIGVAKYEEIKESLAIYKDSVGELYAMPLEKFLGTVEIDGEKKERFSMYLGEEPKEEIKGEKESFTEEEKK